MTDSTLLAKALADIHDLQMRVHDLEHTVHIRIPLALLRASETLQELHKIPSQRVLWELEHEFSKLMKGASNGTSTDPSVPLT